MEEEMMYEDSYSDDGGYDAQDEGYDAGYGADTDDTNEAMLDYDQEAQGFIAEDSGHGFTDDGPELDDMSIRPSFDESDAQMDDAGFMDPWAVGGDDGSFVDELAFGGESNLQVEPEAVDGLGQKLYDWWTGSDEQDQAPYDPVSSDGYADGGLEPAQGDLVEPAEPFGEAQPPRSAPATGYQEPTSQEERHTGIVERHNGILP